MTALSLRRASVSLSKCSHHPAHLEPASASAHITLHNGTINPYSLLGFHRQVVGHNSGDFAEDLVRLVGDVCDVAADAVNYTARTTESGRWKSVTLTAPVANSSMLYKV